MTAVATPTAVETLSYSRAINVALAEEMARDPRVFVMGEDVGNLGGVFAVTRGLQERFGPARVRDTAIAETFIIGGAAGAAMTGTVPVVELQFSDFLYTAADELFNKLAKWRYMHGGRLTLPVVVRAPIGLCGGAGAEHSGSLEALFLHTPGIKVVMPATPADAKGLLKAAIRDPNPVMFFEHKGLYRTKGPVPASDEFVVPLGRAAAVRDGADLTVVASGLMVSRSLEAAARLAADGIEATVIDLRTIVPLDLDTVVESVRRTGRAMVVHEGVRTGGAGAEIAARIQEEAFFHLDAPVWRLGALETPIPQNPNLEELCIPAVEDIVAAGRELSRL
jgi:pyruvate dehydrogenase E1 component beta subunit